MPDERASSAEQTRRKWNDRYQHAERPPEPAPVLRDNVHLLPPAGCALDLACGLGGNALFLAACGLCTGAWDISDVAIARLRHTTHQQGLTMQTAVRNVVTHPPPAASFHVIIISRFLERSLAPFLVQALKPGGLLFYQTFTRIAVEPIGPQEPAYRLAPQELLRLFHALQVVVYREEACIGDEGRGFRNEAMLVGRKVP